MVIVIIVVLIAVGIGLYFGLSLRKSNKEDLENGTLIKRDGDFYNQAELFTLRPVTGEEFNLAAKEIGFPIPVSGKTSNMIFTGSNYQASLQMIEKTDTYCVYRFMIDKWKGRYGLPDSFDLTSMNKLMTSVEKIMLKLDPNTKVKTEEIERKTSPSFF